MLSPARFQDVPDGLGAQCNLLDLVAHGYARTILNMELLFYHDKHLPVSVHVHLHLILGDVYHTRGTQTGAITCFLHGHQSMCPKKCVLSV